MNQLALNVVEAAKAAGISRSTLYEEIRRGELRVLKVGRRSIIRVDDLKRWLDSRPTVDPKGIIDPDERA
jgi:excisionase family DNA binding protein